MNKRPNVVRDLTLTNFPKIRNRKQIIRRAFYKVWKLTTPYEKTKLLWVMELFVC
jgi:hypothetical protein